MFTKAPSSRGCLGHTARLAAGVAAGVAVAALFAGCAVSPEEPGPDELTGLLTTRSDTVSFFGGGATDVYTRVVVLTEEQLLEAYARTWPTSPTPKDYQYGDIGMELEPRDLVRLTAGEAPAATPAVAPVSEGRLRIPWSGDARYLCFGIVDDRKLIRTDGCVLVDEEPPAAVTFQVSVGGIGIEN